MARAHANQSDDESAHEHFWCSAWCQVALVHVICRLFVLSLATKTKIDSSGAVQDVGISSRTTHVPRGRKLTWGRNRHVPCLTLYMLLGSVPRPFGLHSTAHQDIKSPIISDGSRRSASELGSQWIDTGKNGDKANYAVEVQYNKVKLAGAT